MTEQTIKCQICGCSYVFYQYYHGDQSVCPKCRAEAKDKWIKNNPPYGK